MDFKFGGESEVEKALMLTINANNRNKIELVSNKKLTGKDFLLLTVALIKTDNECLQS